MISVKNKKRGVLLPPAVGYSIHIVTSLIFRNKISLRYYPRLIIISLINLINWPFRTYERLIINPRFKNQMIENEPIFIIGHWRSGTTHLHNLLSCDQQMGYITTYQGVFPDTLFNKIGRFIFEQITTLLIPPTRKGDNVTLDPDNPQEEEFALGDKTQLCYYYFWLFPRRIPDYYERYIRFKDLPQKTRRNWRNDYRLLIKKALQNTKGRRFLSKNPSNTGRIKELLELFPNARFIFIHRNPVEVYLSTQHFFEKMMPHLQLQTIDPELLTEYIITVYQKLMHDYLDEKHLIPQEHLIEVGFNELETNPMMVIKNVYEQLGISGFDQAENNFNRYIEKMKSYQKNKHSISKQEFDQIQKELGFFIEKYQYSASENVEIITASS
ncbi:MAG: sulfotransferase [Bacteroidetes bacterium]|nr:sulfotransferase [Bacteroidota bacterium]